MELIKVYARELRRGDVLHLGHTIVRDVERVEKTPTRTTVFLSDGGELPFAPFTVVSVEG